MTTHEELRALAEEATPGPWIEGRDGNNRVYGPDCMGEHSGLLAAVFKGRATIRYIAAANPKRVLALLDEIDQLKEVLFLIETAPTDFGAGVDENMERVREIARAALKVTPC